MIKYADDFLTLGLSKKDLEQIVISKIIEFLAVRKLSLFKEKMKIVDIAQGFNYLGYHFREYFDPKRVKGTKKGIFLVKLSHEKAITFKRDLSKIIR